MHRNVGITKTSILKQQTRPGILCHLNTSLGLRHNTSSNWWPKYPNVIFSSLCLKAFPNRSIWNIPRWGKFSEAGWGTGWARRRWGTRAGPLLGQCPADTGSTFSLQRQNTQVPQPRPGGWNAGVFCPVLEKVLIPCRSLFVYRSVCFISLFWSDGLTAPRRCLADDLSLSPKGSPCLQEES